MDVSCSGNGQCVDGINSAACVCEEGFTGELCETGKSPPPYGVSNFIVTEFSIHCLFRGNKL